MVLTQTLGKNYQTLRLKSKDYRKRSKMEKVCTKKFLWVSQFLNFDSGGTDQVIIPKMRQKDPSW